MAKVHLIGNAHLDPAWLWRWTEGYSEVMSTFRSALDRMNETDDYVFTCAGAAYYSWVEETDPAMFDEIRRRVAEGRWVIVGGWWIQPDCNAPSGESFARHSLISQRYFKARFGRIARTGYNVDSFGHNAMLPQILRQSGMSAYVYMRPNAENEKRYPFDSTAFVWHSPDGSTIPTYRIPNGYGTDAYEGVAEKAHAMLDRAEQSGHPEMCFYGVGNHGGGPTRRALAALDALIGESGEYAYSSPDRYFAELQNGALPEYSGDLQHHASGCYSSVMEIKQLNRRAEYRLLAAEKYLSMARWLGYEIDDSPLDEAWKTLLFNQFHDIMGGCCIYDALQDAIASQKHVLHVAQQLTNRALQRIAWSINTAPDGDATRDKRDFRLWETENHGAPITFFNPNPWAVSAPVRSGVDAGSVVDADGRPVIQQRVRSQVTNGSRDKYESEFIAELPPMGWRTYWVSSAKEPPALISGERGYNDAHLENEYAAVDFDRYSGEMIRYFDKRSGRELISGGRALVIDETESDTWAHNIFSFRNVRGAFGDASVKLVESGEIRSTLRIINHFGASTITRYVSLYNDRPGLYIRYTVNWQEKHAMLKLGFNTPFKCGEVASIPYGSLGRTANGKEQPMQSWVALGGVGFVTDTCAAYDALDGEIRITALRSPIYADHYGERDEFCEFSQQGERRFTMAIIPDSNPGRLAREACEMACPPDRILDSRHIGKLDSTDSLCVVEGEGIMTHAVKRAADGGAYIIRVSETDGNEAHGKIALKPAKVSYDFTLSPYQVKTFRISDDGLEIAETNLIEE